MSGDNDDFVLPDDWHAWMPSAHHNNPEIMAYVTKFAEMKESHVSWIPRLQPRLFYLWGHSYEFERDNNWDHLEAICEKLSGCEDTWYATNMEIYKYVKAYESLEFSADGTIVYNPTLVDIWFIEDGVPHKILSGETLYLK